MKRLNYFKGEFLKKEDFDEEQAYHVNMLREHNKNLHQWGIANGLDVEASGGKVTVKSGMAIDSEGHQIILDNDTPKQIPDNSEFYLTVSYHNEPTDLRNDNPGEAQFTRIEEKPLIEFLKTNESFDPSIKLILAKVTLDKEKITIDKSKRQIVRLNGDLSAHRIDAENGLQIDSDKTSLSGSLAVSGNVGIGTNNPQRALHLYNDTGNCLVLQNPKGGNGTTVSLDFQTYDVNAPLSPTASVKAIDQNWSSHLAVFIKEPGKDENGLIERLRITNEGKVGIGTATPSVSLDVPHGGKFNSIAIGADPHGKLPFDPYEVIQLPATHNLRLFFGTNETTVFQNNGNATIKGSLEANGTVKAAKFAGDGSGLTGIKTGQWTDVEGGISFNNGNVGIGTAIPSVKLEVNGDIKAKSIESKPALHDFKVEGDFDKFYPIFFSDNNWAEGPLILEINRPNVHTDSEWRGSLISKFTVHSGNWGHGADLCRAELYYSSNPFIAGYQNDPFHGRFVVWLRGGGTTYYFRSNHCTTLEDFSATEKKYKISEKDEVVFNIKTSVDSNVLNNAIHFDKNLIIDGNVGIGTSAPVGKLDVRGDIQAGNSDIYFTKVDHNHTGFGNTKGYAAIENAANFDALMILGRSGTPKGRYVRLWDYLQINGGMDVTGNVGIGTDKPSERLEVNGTVKAAKFVGDGSGLTGITGVGASKSQWADITGGISYKGGNVGIGTTDTKRQLHVEGGNSEIHSGGPGAGFSFANRNSNFVDIPSKGERWVLYSSGDPGIAYLWSGKNLLSIDKDGRVGIGTDKSAGKLDVRGDIHAGNSDLYFTKVDHNHTGFGNTAGYAAIENAANYGSLMILGRAGTPKGRYVQLWDYLQINGSMDITGNVGIGTDKPNAKLHVQGIISVNDNDIRLRAGPDTNHGLGWYGGAFKLFAGVGPDGPVLYGNAGGALGLSHDGAQKIALYWNSNGNVGIGTTAPGEKLDVSGTIRLFGKNAFQGHDSFLRINQDNEFPSGTHFNHRANFYAGITTGDWWNVEPGAGNLLVNGNVGIGTTTPSARLEVNGDIKVNGKIIQQDWIQPPLQNGWANFSADYNSAAYFLDKSGIVHLRGLVRSGTINKPIFTLPEGYRPVARELHIVASWGGSTDGYGRCDILTNGDVVPVFVNNVWFSLDGITFRVK